jgi:hypothetical protein
MNDTPHQTTSTPSPESNRTWLQVVTEKVASLRYGVVQVTVHDGKVVQIEKTERTRFDPSRP